MDSTHQRRQPYIVLGNEAQMTYNTIGEAIRKDHPHLVGRHIFEQLDALGLREGFDNGRTPFALPYSFTDY